MSLRFLCSLSAAVLVIHCLAVSIGAHQSQLSETERIAILRAVLITDLERRFEFPRRVFLASQGIESSVLNSLASDPQVTVIDPETMHEKPVTSHVEYLVIRDIREHTTGVLVTVSRVKEHKGRGVGCIYAVRDSATVRICEQRLVYRVVLVAGEWSAELTPPSAMNLQLFAGDCISDFIF